MSNSLETLLRALVASLGLLVAFTVYQLLIAPQRNPLRQLAGPPLRRLLGGHLHLVLNASHSYKIYDAFVKAYGRSIWIRGFLPSDDRLLTLDPASLAHVLKNSTTYEKPWQSRRVITGLIGCGMLAAEGQVHRRQRRVATPAFSIQNLKALVPLVFRKGEELKDRWMEMIEGEDESSGDGVTTEKKVKVDVCRWISRATFDVIGLAGFDYHFNAIQNENNELFNAYKDMFEDAMSQSQGGLSVLFRLYLPILDTIFPNKKIRTVRRCQEVIRRVAGQLVQEKKRKIEDGEKSGHAHGGKDLLSLLLKSNASVDLPPEQRISDEDILHNINTFMFAGSDTTSLALTWTLVLLAEHPTIQHRLRAELLAVRPVTPLAALTPDEMQSLHETLASLPFLHNVARESFRLIPPIHSSIRVATQDDDVPTSSPVYVRKKDGSGYEKRRQTVRVPKGSFVHISVEGLHLDKEFWGEDAWEFNPDRWDHLPEAIDQLPGLFSNLLAFSAGPRSCIGMRFSLIEMKTFLYILLTNFVFTETAEKIYKVNVVLTRPYIAGKFKEGSQCPLYVSRYRGKS